jgi:predicted amidohydrolase
MSKFKLALIQLKSGLDKQENVRRALQFIKSAVVDQRASVVSLPVGLFLEKLIWVLIL